MAERNYRKYTEVFKLEGLALLKQGQKRACPIERELEITPGPLLKWQACCQAVGQAAGFCAFWEHFSGFEFFSLLDSFHTRASGANASRCYVCLHFIEV